MADSEGLGFPIVDTHVHFWDLDNIDWYPPPKGVLDSTTQRLVSEVQRDYQPDDYRRDTAGYDLVGVVHVTATLAPGRHRQEIVQVADLARSEDLPTALIGTIDPRESASEIRGDLEEQATFELFRGIRLTHGLAADDPKLHEVFRACAERGWVFDLVCHPDNAADFASAVASAPDTTFVLEHTGWPRAADDEHFAMWRSGISRLAQLPNVSVKLSGLAMPLQSVAPDRLRPWIETAIEAFGPERAFFSSNFPVDRVFGSFAELYGSYREITAAMTPAEVHALFVGNAARVYRLSSG